MRGQPTADLNLGSAHSVAEVLRKHVLFELEGMPGQEVADLVGRPLDTMWTRLFHARREFKAKLAERGITSSEDLSRVPELSK